MKLFLDVIKTPKSTFFWRLISDGKATIEELEYSVYFKVLIKESDLLKTDESKKYHCFKQNVSTILTIMFQCKDTKIPILVGHEANIWYVVHVIWRNYQISLILVIILSACYCDSRW